MKLLLLPGDGIGKEIFPSVYSCLNILNKILHLGLKLSTEDIGLSRLIEHGNTMPQNLLDKAKLVDGIILGPLSTLDYDKHSSNAVNVSSFLRKELDLYANIRPSYSFSGISKVNNMDLIIVRENTEGFFADRSMYLGMGEFMPTKDIALSIRKVTRVACERILQVACKLAQKRKKKVAVVHKVNTLKYSDGLFLDIAKEMEKEFLDISFTYMLVDATAAKLITESDFFDIIVTTNLFGDILSDEAAALSGSLGMAGSINFGEDFALAQAVHGSATDIAGLNKANPIGILCSTGLLLDWFGQKKNKPNFIFANKVIQQAIKNTLRIPSARTEDIGGKCTTKEFIAYIENEIHAYI